MYWFGSSSNTTLPLHVSYMDHRNHWNPSSYLDIPYSYDNAYHNNHGHYTSYDDDPWNSSHYYNPFLTVNRVIQYWLDKSTVYPLERWFLFTIVILLFSLRVYLTDGYFIVAYGLGIFLLNNFIAFLSPLDDPATGDLDDGTSLPTTVREGKEYRPFVRKLPEFKFWLSCTRGAGISFLMTFFSIFDVPVFWPILVIYFFMLFFFTMKRQIMHMYKYKYVPLSWGKTKYKNAGVEQGMYGGGMAGSTSRKGT